MTFLPYLAESLMATDFGAFLLFLAWYLPIRGVEHFNFVMKFHEIAEIFGGSVSTAHSQMKVGMEHLRQILAR